MKTLLTFLFVMVVSALSAESSINPITPDVPPLREEPIAGQYEMNVLNNIISLTKENLQNEMKLREQVILYRDLYDQYIENKKNRNLLAKVVLAAYDVEKTLAQTHLQHAFSQDFLRELSLFATVAKKRSIPRP